MKNVRRIILSIVSGAAIAGAVVAFAETGAHGNPRGAPVSRPQEPFAPPMYFGPAYSTAAVYDYLQSTRGVREARMPKDTSPRTDRRSTPAMVGRVGLEPTTKGL